MRTPDLKSLSRTQKRVLVAAALACGLVVAIGAGVALASGNPFAKYPPAKAAILQREQHAMATAQAHPHATKPAHPTPPASTSQPTPVAGIDDTMHQGPFSACEFTVVNFWQGPANGAWELVYAGASNADVATCSDGSGAVAIYSEQMGRYGDGPITNVGLFAAPEGVKSLTIIAVNGDIMTLRTDAGATLSFNLATNKFSAGN